MRSTSAHLQLVPNETISFSTLIPEQNIHDRRVKKVIRLMNKDVAQPMTLASVADFAEISPRQLSRLFVIETKYSPMQYLHELRFERACFLLLNSFLRIKDICHQVGVEDVSNFRHEFKKRKGCCPGEFRNKKTWN